MICRGKASTYLIQLYKLISTFGIHKSYHSVRKARNIKSQWGGGGNVTSGPLCVRRLKGAETLCKIDKDIPNSMQTIFQVTK